MPQSDQGKIPQNYQRSAAVSRTVRALCEMRGWGSPQLAARCQEVGAWFSRHAASDIFQGRTRARGGEAPHPRAITVDDLEALARALDVSESVLLNGVGSTPEQFQEADLHEVWVHLTRAYYAMNPAKRPSTPTT